MSRKQRKEQIQLVTEMGSNTDFEQIWNFFHFICFWVEFHPPESHQDKCLSFLGSIVGKINKWYGVAFDHDSKKMR